MAYEIPGSVISAADEAKAAAASAAESAKPSYADMMNTIKDGEIFVDVSPQIAALKALRVDTSAVEAAIEKAKAQIQTDMAVANAALTQKIKEAQAAGTTVTDADQEAAVAPLTVIKNYESSINSTIEGVKGDLAIPGVVLGAAPPSEEGVDVLPAVREAATAFEETIPPEEIEEGGVTIPNPAYFLFFLVPANIAKNIALESVNSTTESTTTSLSSLFGGFASTAANAKNDTIKSLKAGALLSTLTKSMNKGIAAATGAGLVLGSIDKFAAVKALEAPPKIALEKTPDEVRPAGTANILKGNRFAVDPALTKRIWTYELNGLAKDQDKKNADYYKALGTTFDAPEKDKQTAVDTWFNKLFTPEQQKIRAQAKAIRDSKPDPEKRTDEEKAIFASAKANATAIKEGNPEYIRVQVVLWGEFEKYRDWYKLVYNTWLSTNDRYTLPEELLKVLSSYKP